MSGESTFLTGLFLTEKGEDEGNKFTLNFRRNESTKACFLDASRHEFALQLLHNILYTVNQFPLSSINALLKITVRERMMF